MPKRAGSGEISGGSVALALCTAPPAEALARAKRPSPGATAGGTLTASRTLKVGGWRGIASEVVQTMTVWPGDPGQLQWISPPWLFAKSKKLRVTPPGRKIVRVTGPELATSPTLVTSSQYCASVL